MDPDGELRCVVDISNEEPSPRPTQQGDGERFSALIKSVRVDGVELHYLEIGSGMPVVLIHGGLGDYREWNPQIERISSHYRVIAYSRRYNYPNNNAEVPPDHSAIVEARDLAALLDALKLERVHIVGYSYSALTALFFATEHPQRVCSVTLAEPPILGWLPEIPGGQAELDKFMQTMWRPAGEAFRRDVQRRRCGSRAIISAAKDHMIRCRRSSGNPSWTTFGNGRLSPHREMRSPC